MLPAVIYLLNLAKQATFLSRAGHTPQAVRAAGGVPALVELLQHSGGGGPVPSAAWALAQLMQGSQEAAKVRNCNVNCALSHNPQLARHGLY